MFRRRNQRLKKCRKIVGHFHYSEPVNRKWQNVKNNADCQNILWCKIAVRWNSRYLMLERLLEKNNAVNLYSVEYGMVDTLVFNKRDVIMNFTAILKFFYDATFDLSYESLNIKFFLRDPSLIAATNRNISISMK